MPVPSEQHPLDQPFAFAFIRLDGATTPLLHAVDAGSADAMSVGARVAPRWGTPVPAVTVIVGTPADEDLRLVCMFTPALTGDEAHHLTESGIHSSVY